jgi:hypothetical protein
LAALRTIWFKLMSYDLIISWIISQISSVLEWWRGNNRIMLTFSNAKTKVNLLFLQNKYGNLYQAAKWSVAVVDFAIFSKVFTRIWSLKLIPFSFLILKWL